MTPARQTHGRAAGQGANESAAAGAEFLRAPNLQSAGVPHGFGMRNSAEPPGVRRATQVHGARVLCADDPTPAATAQPAGETPRPLHRAEADALYATQPGVAIGVVTADCVPILLAALAPAAAAPAVASTAVAAPSPAATALAPAAASAPATAGAFAVAAIHAGWRGLAAGVIESAVAALRRAAPRSALCAAIGPHIGPCCYEVDAPVLSALFPAAPSPQTAPPNALHPTRPGHFLLNLGAVAQHRLTRAGLPAAHITTIPRPCTRCAPHFASYRRDGAQSGRMLHWIAVPQREA